MTKIQIYRTERPHASSSVGGSKCDCPDLKLNDKDVEVVDGVQNINACTQIKTNNSEYSVDKQGVIKLTNLTQTIKVNDKLYDADDDGVIDLGTIGGGDANVKIKVNNVEHEATEGVVDLGSLANRVVIDNNEYYVDGDGAVEINNLDYVKKVDSLDDYLPAEERAVYNRGDDNYYRTEWRQDDVATTFLGEQWRLPTADEMAELANLPVAYDQTAQTFTITAENGNSITIPACGVRRSADGGDDIVGTAVGLWTSQRADWADDAIWAYWLDERAGYTDYNEFNLRYEGYAVLPVTTTDAVGSVDLGLSVRWASALLGKDKTLNNSDPIHVQWASTKNTETGDYYTYEFAIVDDYGYTEYNLEDGREVLGPTPLWKKVDGSGGGGGSTVVANTEGVDASIVLNNITIDGQVYDTNQVRAISVNQGERYYTPKNGQFDINVATSATLNNTKVVVDNNGVLAMPPTASKLRVDGNTYDVTPQGIIDIDTDISQYISFAGARSLGAETYINTIPVESAVYRQPLDDGSDNWPDVNTVGMWAVWAEVGRGGTYVTRTRLEDGFMVMQINYTIDIIEKDADGYGQSVYDSKIVFDTSHTCRINVTIDYDVTRDVIKGVAIDKRDETNMVEGLAVTGAQIGRTATTAGQVILSAWRMPRLVLKMHDLTKQYTCAASASFPRTNRRTQRLVVDQQRHNYEAKYAGTLISPRWDGALYVWDTKESETGIPHDFTVYVNSNKQVVNQAGQALYNIVIKEEYESQYEFTDFSFMNLIDDNYDGWDWDGNAVHIPRVHVAEDMNEAIEVDYLTMSLSYPDLDWNILNYIPMAGTCEYKTGTLAVYHSARKIKFGGRIYDVDLTTGIIDLDAQ